MATLKTGRGQHRKYLPEVFTEHGAIIAATILNTPLAVEVSVYVARAFVRLRAVISANKEIARKPEQLERKMESHEHKLTPMTKRLPPCCPRFVN